MIQIRRIVCPTDFSPTAARAVDYAAEMARSFDAELTLLHVIPEMTYPLRSFGMATAFPHLREELHQRADDALQQIKAQLGANTKVSTLLRDGDAHAQVLECAKSLGADLIVMGTHGHTGLRHALLGSTAEKVVRLSECPVLTVRASK
ncbi:MAG: universal stress protein [Planctomycetes bacterium]|nr:universal stress protein [Planctomycetota bacterium]